MTFEEEFPSLKNSFEHKGAYNKLSIINHCLDKQRVKETVEKTFNHQHKNHHSLCLICDLIKELEL